MTIHMGMIIIMITGIATLMITAMTMAIRTTITTIPIRMPTIRMDRVRWKRRAEG